MAVSRDRYYRDTWGTIDKATVLTVVGETMVLETGTMVSLAEVAVVEMDAMEVDMA